MNHLVRSQATMTNDHALRVPSPAPNIRVSKSNETPMTKPNTPITYRDAGVDIDRGNELVERIRPLAKATHRDGVLSGVGGFGALFQVPTDRYREPVLVSGADGVGTKLKLAIELGIHHTVGIDLVAMCVNDILVLGAEPLFFLDYFATAELDNDVAEAVIAGIADGCKQAGAALVGGECAEMPGMYNPRDYDLAGFCVGVVEKSKVIDPSRLAEGDAIIGLASSGVHSNGFSLVRKILERTGQSMNQPMGSSTLGETLLAPTKIYAKPLLSLFDRLPVRGIAHITGGGLLENIDRILPPNTQAHLDSACWERPAVFDWIEQHAGLEAHDMQRTFNCGIGLVLMVSEADAPTALDALRDAGETAAIIGKIRALPTSADPTVLID